MTAPSSSGPFESPERRLTLVVPAELDRPTGGNRYDQALATALRERGVPVDEQRVAGRWPVGSASDRAELARRIAANGHATSGPAGHRAVLVDGLLACGAPEVIADATRAGDAIHVLVHMPLAWPPDLPPARARTLDRLERSCLHAATSTIATSDTTAADLIRRHRLDPATVSVASPGCRPAPPATGSTPAHLVQVAAVTPVKDQLTVVEALSRVRSLAWTAELIGPIDVDPGYVRTVRDALGAHGLADRVRLTGPLDAAELADRWAVTDLLLLPSRAEAWGMVVTEALARGIPAVVTAGTGAQEALGRAPDGTLPGALVPAEDPAALAAAVADLLGAGGPAARRAAAARRGQLRAWSATADDVLAAIGRGRSAAVGPGGPVRAARAVGG